MDVFSMKSKKEKKNIYIYIVRRCLEYDYAS